MGRVCASHHCNCGCDPISPPCFEPIFENSKQRGPGAAHTRTSDPIFVLFFLPETRSTARRWRSPLINFFPPSLSGPFSATLLLIPNPYFYRGFRPRFPLQGQPQEEDPRTNFRPCSKNAPLFNRQNFGKQKRKLMCGPGWCFFGPPCSRP